MPAHRLCTSSHFPYTTLFRSEGQLLRSHYPIQRNRQDCTSLPYQQENQPLRCFRPLPVCRANYNCFHWTLKKESDNRERRTNDICFLEEVRPSKNSN